MTIAVESSAQHGVLRFLPPPKVLRKAIPIALVLLLPVGIAGWLGGLGVAIVTMLALAIAVGQAVNTRGATQSWFVLAIAVVAAIGSVTTGNTAADVIVVSLAALLAYPGNRVSAGLLSMAPVLAVLEGLGVVKVGWVAAFFAALLAGIYVVLVVRLMRIRLTPRPVKPALAARHAVVLAVICGAATWVSIVQDLPHGYWVIVTIAVVLRPSISESTVMVRDRVIGTVIGSLIAVIVGDTLPEGAVWVVVAVFLWLDIGYTLVHRTVGAAIATTVLVIVMVAPSTDGGTWTTAFDRLVWTLVGAALAVVAGLFLRGADTPDDSVAAPLGAVG
jgi:hypothetical protein